MEEANVSLDNKNNDVQNEIDNTYEFEYYSYHTDDLIDMHNELKNNFMYLGLMNTSKSYKFLDVINRCLYFYDKNILHENDDDPNEDFNIEEDIVLNK